MLRLPEARPATLARTAAIAFATVLLLSAGGIYYKYRTEPTSPPQLPAITNLSETEATMSWTTQIPTWGIVLYSDDERAFKNLFLARFRANAAVDDHGLLSKVHHVTLKNLDPKKKYYYRISTGLHTYDKPAIGEYPTLETLYTISPETPSPQPFPAYGLITRGNGEIPAYPAIVYLEKDGALKRSTLTNLDGGWSMDLSSFRTSVGEFAPHSPNGDIYTLRVASEEGATSTIISSLEAQPTPIVHLP